jgi:hypothetical protein
VAVALEETVLRAAHLIRRAHWLQELCSCNLLWHPRGDAGSLRVLVVREGKVIDRFLDGARPLEPPPNVPLGMRLAWLDSATHDRIRVLGTELKRLAIRDSELTLQLGRGCLARRSLARRIWWV